MCTQVSNRSISDGQTTEIPEYTFELVQTPGDWDSASTECISRDSQLAWVKDNDTQAALQVFLDQQGVPGADVWIGARQEDSKVIITNPHPVWRWNAEGELLLDFQ